MNEKQKWWMLGIVLVLLLAVGIGLSLARPPVDRILTPQEAAGYQVYDVVLPEGESSPYACLYAHYQTYQADAEAGLAAMEAALYHCKEVVALSLSEWEGKHFLHLTYEGLDGEDVSLYYREDDTLVTRQVYFPARDMQIIYEAETGDTRMVSPIRFGSGKL